MRNLRYLLWGMVAALAVSLTYLYTSGGLSRPQSDVMYLGGEFNLVRHDGKPISDKDLLGKPYAIFFGFTNCPEVCPTSLFEISTWLEAMGKDGDRIAVYFMTVDPERDTTELLKEYLSSFDPRIVGITGDKVEIAKTLRAFKVFFQRVELDDGDYTMDHTASIYLMNAAGKFVRTIAYGEDGDTAIAKMKKMLN